MYDISIHIYNIQIVILGYSSRYSIIFCWLDPSFLQTSVSTGGHGKVADGHDQVEGAGTGGFTGKTCGFHQ